MATDARENIFRDATIQQIQEQVMQQVTAFLELKKRMTEDEIFDLITNASLEHFEDPDDALDAGQSVIVGFNSDQLNKLSLLQGGNDDQGNPNIWDDIDSRIYDAIG